jgi:hypothetical protein
MSQAVGYLRAQAERCLRLAKACTNAAVVASLTDMAANSFERANEMESGAVRQTEQTNPRRKSGPPQLAACVTEARLK